MRYIRERDYLVSIVSSLVLFTLGIISVSYSTNYATSRASNSVTDIILSNTPVFNVGPFFVYGAVAMGVFIIAVIVSQPQRLPFSLKTLGFFCLIRSMFVSLTHLNTFPDQISLSQTYFTTSRFFSGFFTGDDFFFSGHTGIPFLMALIFWDYPKIRYTFFALSVFFACIVLMGHLHYSIDVFSAYFITYSIYALARELFTRDYPAAKPAD